MLLAHGFLARLFSVFAAHRIVVDLLSTSEVSVSLTVDREERLELALRDLREFAEVDVQRGRALICVVGEGLKQTPGLTGKIFSVLGREGVNVELISQGASRINLSFVVSDGDAERAVRRLHRNLFGGG
jgi:aspartate kinase